MFGLEGSLIPPGKDGARAKAVVAGFDPDSIAEMQRLLDTSDVDMVESQLLVLKKVSPGTYLGLGKVQALEEALVRTGAEFAVIDTDLSPNQVRNLEKAVKKPVLDRYGVILEIFHRHGRTKEAKTQVELARLLYLQSRLTHLWTHFGRQGAGGKGNRGMGEKQLEVDRRILARRVALLKKRLTEIQKERGIRRAARRDVLKVALVGYTNAGKSTLLNALTKSHVVAEDKLFVTLDPSVRMLDPFCHPPLVAIDTVGFIRNLPHGLVASFRATLEELNDADLLLHVVDGSSKTARDEMTVTEEILKDLELDDTPRIVVLNKSDLVDGAGAKNQLRLISPGAIRISALNPGDVDKVRDLVMEHFRGRMEIWEVVIPYAEGKLESQIQAHGQIEAVKYLEKGIFYRLRIDQIWAKKLGLDRFPPAKGMVR
ncbi:MAG TPA: GTPase HflX [Bdellovibrionota bacterium]|nr:GTPase HflX [Bdellovibrionota bacterium]